MPNGLHALIDIGLTPRATVTIDVQAMIADMYLQCRIPGQLRAVWEVVNLSHVGGVPFAARASRISSATMLHHGHTPSL